MGCQPQNVRNLKDFPREFLAVNATFLMSVIILHLPDWWCCCVCVGSFPTRLYVAELGCHIAFGKKENGVFRHIDYIYLLTIYNCHLKPILPWASPEIHFGWSWFNVGCIVNPLFAFCLLVSLLVWYDLPTCLCHLPSHVSWCCLHLLMALSSS